MSLNENNWKKLDFVECGQNYCINLETAEIRNDKTGRIRKPHNDKDGYMHLCLNLNGKQKWYRVHILMYKAHYGDYDATKYVIDHINHVKTDNNIENLRLATISLNSINISQMRGKQFEYLSDLPDSYTINEEHGIYFCKTYNKFYRKVSESQYREIHEEKVTRNTTQITWIVNGKRYRYTTTSIRHTLL